MNPLNIANLEKKLESETGTSWTLGVSTLLSPGNPVKAINKIVEANLNFQRIEISLPERPDDEKRVANQLTKERKKNNLEYSVHTPFLYDNLAHPKESVREIYVDEGIKAIDLAARIGAGHVVFHPGVLFYRRNLPPLDVFESFRKSREVYLENSLRSLTEISGYATSQNIATLIENLPHGLCDRPEDVKFLLSKLENSNFLLDIGHANISDSLEDLLELNPQYFHFHDNDGKKDNHEQLGKGTIDLDWLIARLSNSGGSKTIIFELYSLDDVLSSLENLEKSLES